MIDERLSWSQLHKDYDLFYVFGMLVTFTMYYFITGNPLSS